jgi:hypothetical protein
VKVEHSYRMYYQKKKGRTIIAEIRRERIHLFLRSYRSFDYKVDLNKIFLTFFAYF